MRKSGGQVTTWLIDADKQLLSNYLLDLLKKKIIKNNLAVDHSKLFSLLTTPEKPSYVEIESQESLEIVQLIKKDLFALKMFLEEDASVIKQNLVNFKVALKNKILAHHQKWLWLHYNYEGPILELDYFIEVWKGLVKENNLEKQLREAKTKPAKTKKQRIKLFNKLKLSPKEKQFFNIARDIVWLKAYRKDCMYYATHVLDKIVAEIGKRLNINLGQTRALAYWEVKDALTKKKVNADELDQRYKSSIIYTNSVDRPIIFIGQKARKYLQKQRFEKEKIEKVDELVGNCASPGRAKGKVCIVETVDDIPKMKDGDILLSETTYPALVPAMRKAAAIVTNVGGLTCHAAIVSRELKIPCIVGTKTATRVFKDGEKVSVNATKGIIKKLTR